MDHCTLVQSTHGEELKIDVVAYGQKLTGKAKGRLALVSASNVPRHSSNTVPSADSQLDVKSTEYKTCGRIFNKGYMRVPGVTRMSSIM
jgi:hypothetical protein